MKKFKKSYRILSLLLSICMIAAFLPMIGASAAVTYLNHYTGSESISLASQSKTDVVFSKDVAGFNGKAASDLVYTYTGTNAGTGYGYFSLTKTLDHKTQPADSQVIEFNLLLEDETSEFHFSPAFLRQAGYEYYLANGKFVDESGKSYYGSLNSLFKFSASGILVYDSQYNTNKVRYLNSSFHNKYLSKNEDGTTTAVSAADATPITVGKWHSIAIRLPGLLNGKSDTPYVNADGETVENAYAGGTEIFVCIDGVEYVVPTAQNFWGTRHIKIHGKNKVHFDNVNNFFASNLEDPDDYKNSTMLATLTPASDKIAVDDSDITVTGNMTVAEFESSFTGADAVRVYTATSATSKVKLGDKVVAVAKNGDTIERSYNYYKISGIISDTDEPDEPEVPDVPDEPEEPETYEEPGLYSGASALSFSYGDTNENKSCNTIVDGVFGKLAEDKVYMQNVTGKNHTGFNYIGALEKVLYTNNFEFSLAIEQATSFSAEASFYTAEDKSTNTKGTLLSVTSTGVVKTGTTSGFFASGYSGKELGTIKPGQWANIAFRVPGCESIGSSTNTLYISVNGVEHEIKLANQFYGTKHLRFAPASNDTTLNKTYYYDNVRKYSASEGEVYDVKKDAQPSFNLGTLNVAGDVITLAENTTVAQLTQQITTSATVRVFEDNTYKTVLSAAETIPNGAVVVFATNNKRTTERTYAYYQIAVTESEEPDTYEEPGLLEGTTAFTLGSTQTDCSITNNVDGVYGKAASDKVYRLDIAGNVSTGYNFISSNGNTLDTVVFEFSYALPDETAKLAIETSFYKTAKAADKVDEVSNTLKGTILSFSAGKISTGSVDSLAAASKSKVLYEGKPGEWVNIAMVIPGYNQTSTGTEKIFMYINGIKHEIFTSVPVYGTRHMRLSPSTKSVFYLDNIRKYQGASEQYKPEKDLKPVYDETKVDASEGNINVAKGTTVEQFKQLFDESVKVRVFANDNLTTILEDTDVITSGNVLVLATNNKRTTERAYSYFTINRPLNVVAISITNADGKIIRGTSSDISRMGETYYLNTNISNKAAISSANLKAIVATYDSLGNMTYCDIKDVVAGPGTTIISHAENPVAFENIITPENGTLKAFLWMPDTNEPLCEEFETVFDGVEEYNILSIGNSYSNNSHIYLPAIAAADGVVIKTVNLYEGGCPIDKHYGFMKGTTSGGYDHVYQHTVNGSVSLGTNVKFEDGFNTPGYTWDYVTIHQKGQYSPFYHRYYTEEKPYITEIAEYVRKNSPGSEFLFFESWAPYTDRIEEIWDVYQPLCEGLTREEYIPTVFGAIKDCYLRAAEQVGNPNRVIPAGEAIYLATQKYGFTEYVDNSSTTDTSFSDAAGAIYLDTSSHLTTYGKVLSALTWYEYLTGHDVTQNSYQNSKVSAEDMALLKQIAHEACQMAEYNPQK